MERRKFISRLFGETLTAVSECKKELDNIKTDLGETIDGMLGLEEEEPLPDFFDSYEMSYSLTLAYPRDLFEQMAEKAGIEHAGRETIEIAKELHDKGVI